MRLVSVGQDAIWGLVSGYGCIHADEAQYVVVMGRLLIPGAKPGIGRRHGMIGQRAWKGGLDGWEEWGQAARRG